jgi:hypothetical protein
MIPNGVTPAGQLSFAGILCYAVQSRTGLHILARVNTWPARLGGTVGAIGWLIGVPLIAATGLIPYSGEQYFLEGVTGSIVGCSIVALAFGLPIDGVRSRGQQALRAIGIAVGALLAATSLLLALAARGALGIRAPEWIPRSASGALLALFLWVLAFSVVWRRAIGDRVCWLGVIAGASFVIGTLVSAWNPTITDYTLPFDIVVVAGFWLGLTAWLLLLVWQPRTGHSRGSITPESEANG